MVLSSKYAVVLCYITDSLFQGGTILGQPLKVQDMGDTHITLDVFEEFLRGKQPRFRYNNIIVGQRHTIYSSYYCSYVVSFIVHTR